MLRHHRATRVRSRRAELAERPCRGARRSRARARARPRGAAAASTCPRRSGRRSRRTSPALDLEADVVDERCRADRIRRPLRRRGPTLIPSRRGRLRVRQISQRKNGPPISEVTTPSGSSLGTTRVRAPRSARTRSAAPARKLAGSSVAWDGPVSKPDQVGHDEPDERDHAGRRDGGADRQRERDDEHEPRTLGVDAEMARLALAEGEEVEVAGVPDRRRRRRSHERRRHGDERPGGAAEAAERPEDDVAHLLVVGTGDHEPDRGRRDGRDRDPGQDQCHRLGPALVAREGVDDERRRDAAREGAELEGAVEGAGDSEDDRRDGADRRPARDADHGRVGERIAEEALERRPTDGEAAADEDAEENAGEPDRPQIASSCTGAGAPTSIPRCRRMIPIASSGGIRTAPTPSRAAARRQATRRGPRGLSDAGEASPSDAVWVRPPAHPHLEPSARLGYRTSGCRPRIICRNAMPVRGPSPRRSWSS